MTFVGSPRAAFISFGMSEVLVPGPMAEMKISRLAPNQSSIVLMPLFWLKLQTLWLGTGTPSQPNFRPSNFAALLPMTCWSTSGAAKAPMVRPSGFAVL